MKKPRSTTDSLDLSRSQSDTPTTDNEPSWMPLLFIPEQDIPYPENAEWHNLGAHIRQQVVQRKQWRRQRRLAVLVALAAAMTVLLGSSILFHQSPQPAANVTIAKSESSMQAPAAADTEDDTTALLAELEMYDLQNDLDALLLDCDARGIACQGGSTAVWEILEVEPEEASEWMGDYLDLL